MRLSLILLLTACFMVAPVSAQEESAPTARLALANDILTLDPGRLSPFDYGARNAVENLFVGLMVHDPQTASLTPGLAARWDISEDGLTWTFTLREDIHWVRHNPATGETHILRPVTADDFVFSLRRACSPVTGSRHAGSIFIVQGCQVIFRSDPRFVTSEMAAQRLGVRALDARTVEYKLLFPAAYFLSFTAMPEFRPLPQEHVEVPTAWAEQGSIVTNGPFVVAEWIHSHRLILARSPHWPGAYAGNVARVEITFESNIETALQNFAAGRLDRLDAPAGAVPPEAASLTVRPSVTVLGASFERAPMAQRGLRQALAWSIDRAALVNQAVGPGEGIPLAHFTAPGMVAGPPADAGQGYSPDAARQALANAGYANCQSIPEVIKIMVDSSTRSQAVAAFLIESWQRDLNCNPGLFEVVQAPFDDVVANARATFSDEEGYLRPHLWLVSWTADYYDAHNWAFDALHCRYGIFRTDSACDETDALVETAGVEYDAAARAGLYAEIADRWFGTAGKYPVIPLYANTQPAAQQPWLSGVGRLEPARFGDWVIERRD